MNNVSAERGAIFRYGGTPLAGEVPGDLMGSDVASDRYEPPKGFSLLLRIKSTAAAERVFRDLAEGDKVVMPLEDAFWAARFGVLVDRFGIPWQINREGVS